MAASDTEAIVTTGLTKFYGKNRGIEDVSFHVAKGEVFGFLGPNGAGKSTTIRLLLDLIRPSRGAAQIFGRDTHADSVAIRRSLGYLPGEPAWNADLTGAELLDFYAGLRDRHDRSYRNGLAERLDLDLSRRIGQLSRGNKQKVALIQALMHKPDLVVLDEPTSGLDPLVQHEVLLVLRESAAEGRTVFLSSHVLSEVEHVADRVGIIREGRLAVVETIERLKSRALRSIDVRFGRAVPAGAFEGLPGVKEATVRENFAHFMVEGTIDALVKAAAQFEVLDIVSEEADLEEIFLTYYRGDEVDA